jgi:hypothetical protein
MDNDYDPTKYDAKIAAFNAQDTPKAFDTSTLEDFEVVDGKSRDEEEIQKLKKLEDLLGMKEMNPYGTLDRAIFEEKLADMTITDMQSLAMRVGSQPSRDRLSLRAGLRKSFDAYIKQHGSGFFGPQEPVIDPSSPNYETIVKLFRE